jgi:hypothetical protein
MTAVGKRRLLFVRFRGKADISSRSDGENVTRGDLFAEIGEGGQ